MKSLLTLAIILTIGIVTVPKAEAITCYALDDANQLLSFDSNTPGTASTAAITGLPAGYTLVGIDFRVTTQKTGAANPGVGSLWAIGTNGTNFRLFVINRTTGAATAIGGNLAGLTDGGAGDEGWGFGFDPATDRIRFIGFIRNYSIDPNTLAVQADPAPVVQGDEFHNMNGAAYTTASFGGSSQFYNVDDNIHALLTSSNLSASGTLTPVGSGLGFNNTTPNGLDIYGDFTLWAGQPGGTTALFNVNRLTGAASPIGNIMGNPLVRGLAILPNSFPPKISISVKINGRSKLNTTQPSRLVKGVVQSNVGFDRIEFRVGTVGNFKKVKTISGKQFSFTARLKKGRNVISARARVGATTSNTAKIVVIRK